MFNFIKQTTRFRNFKFRLQHFAKHCEGVAALEFALIAPLFFAMVFALLEMLTFMIGSMTLEDATKRIEFQMQQDRNAGQAFNLDTYRGILCNNVMGVFISNCDAENVKIKLWYAGRQVDGSTNYQEQIAFPIEDGIDPTISTQTGDIWIIAVQLNWPYILPTTKLLNIMPNVQGGEIKPILATTRTAVILRELIADPTAE